MTRTTNGFAKRTAARVLSGVYVVLSAACGGAEEPEVGPAEVVTSLRIEGVVDLGPTIATDVRVTGRCGQYELTTMTDGDGRYSFEVGELECDRIVIEHEKTGFLPAYRVVPVPPSESPFALEVELEAMDALECGKELCHTADRSTDVTTGGVIARGFQAGQNGDRALDYIPPDMRTDDGELISFLGFQYVELYDQPGEPLDTLDPVEGCVRITNDALTWIGDMEPSTPIVDLDWYRYDARHGVWTPIEQTGRLMYRRGDVFVMDEFGTCVDVKDERGEKRRELLPLERDSLADARAEEHYVPDPCSRREDPDPIHVREYWVCGMVDQQGFYAYGRSAPEQSCYALQVTNACDEPIQSVEFTARGVEHGFLHKAFTGPDGSACIDVMASEPIGEDFDLDGLGGEVFAVDLEVNGGRAGSKRVDHQENALEMGSCERPETCIQLTEQLRGCSE